MAKRIFISYSGRDKPTAVPLCTALEKAGLRCWMAPRDIPPGSDWTEAIADAVENASAVLLILSATANESSHVKRELEIAVHKNVAIVPFRIERVESSKSLEYLLGTIQYLDAFDPPLERHIQTVIRTLQPRESYRTEERGAEPSPRAHPPLSPLDEALERLMPAERTAWTLANGDYAESIPLTSEEIAVRLRCLPEDVQQLLVSAGAKIRKYVYGAGAVNASMLAGRKVILVEDDPIDLRRMRFVLRDTLGMSVHTADNGEDALKLISEARGAHEKPMLILDMHLPLTKTTGAPTGPGDPTVGECLLLEAAPEFPVVVYSSLLRVADGSSKLSRDLMETWKKKWGRLGALRSVEKPDLDGVIEALTNFAAATSKAGPAATGSEKVEYSAGPCKIEIHPATGRVLVDGKPVDLEVAEFDVLLSLIRHARSGAAAPNALLQGLAAEGRDLKGALTPRQSLKSLLERLTQRLSSAGLKIQTVEDIATHIR